MAVSSVPVPTIDATGFHMPAFADVLAAHQADYQSIYGSDVVLTSDTQDGQWVAIEAQGFYDCFTLALSVYNSFSPATAQGVGLSSVVKINGIERNVASFSTCDLQVIGVAGTILTNCVARDESGLLWSLPTTVVIPLSGMITATATCQTIGAVSAPIGTIDQIATPTRGLQSISNATVATVGSPVESDPQLRIRQAQSTELPSQTLLDGLVGSIDAMPSVVRIQAYVNDTDLIDTNGLPGHSIALVVDGGDSTAIANLIATRKGVAGTYGTTVVPVTSSVTGITRNISFFRPTEPVVNWSVTLKPLAGFTTDVQAAIAQALSDWTNALGIGTSILVKRAYAPALLVGSAFANTFELEGVAVSRDSGAPAEADVAFAFNEAPSCVPAAVTFVLTS